MSVSKKRRKDALASDGRRRRSDENRRRIALGMLDLVRAGAIMPSADQVAERAGVGRRTVFRLFDDMEGVYREMHAVMVGRIKPLLDAPIEGATWRERLERLIERRAGIFEEMLPIKSAADIHRYQSQFLQKEHEALTRMLRDVLLFTVPRSVAKDTLTLEALDFALSFEAWRRLRKEQRLGVKQALHVLQHMARALLD